MRLGVGELLLDVLAGQSHVVDADAAVFDELGDGRLLRSGFEQFDFGLAQHEERRANLLVGHFLDRITFQTDHVFPIGDCLIKALHCNAKMLDVRYFHG